MHYDINIFVTIHALWSETNHHTQAERSVAPGDSTDDVDLFEQCHPKRGLELRCWYCHVLGARDADLGLAGHQDHHYCFYVWDGDTGVLAKTSAPHR